MLQGKKNGLRRQSTHQNQSSDIKQILEISNREFLKTMIIMLMTLTERVDNMKEQMSNISRKFEGLRENQKEMQEI